MTTTYRYIGTATGTATTSGTTCTATLPISTGATAILVAIAVNQTNVTAALVSTVTDSAGNSYTKRNATSAASGAGDRPSVEMWYCLNPVTSLTTSTLTVTLANPAPSIALQAFVMGSTTGIDRSTTVSAASSQTFTVSITPAAGDELILTAAAMGVDTTLSTLSSAEPGAFPAVVAVSGSGATAGSQLLCIFESRPGTTLTGRSFAQTGLNTYVATCLAMSAPLAPGVQLSSALTPITSWIKDPDAVLDWTYSWSNWLSGVEIISSSTFLADPGIAIQAQLTGTTSATVWLAGGTPGSSYTVTNRITTTGGRTDDRSITIRVQDK